MPKVSKLGKPSSPVMHIIFLVVKATRRTFSNTRPWFFRIVAFGSGPDRIRQVKLEQISCDSWLRWKF